MDKTLTLTDEELSVLEDAIIWKLIEEEKWVRDTYGHASELDKQIYKSSSAAVAALTQLKKKVRTALLEN